MTISVICPFCKRDGLVQLTEIKSSIPDTVAVSCVFCSRTWSEPAPRDRELPLIEKGTCPRCGKPDLERCNVTRFGDEPTEWVWCEGCGYQDSRPAQPDGFSGYTETDSPAAVAVERGGNMTEPICAICGKPESEHHYFAPIIILPPGCQCTQDSWRTLVEVLGMAVPPVCDAYIATEWGRCERCEHDAACHATTDQRE